MANIYDTNIDWAQANSYQKHAIVKKNGNYYYALKVINAGTAFSLNDWGGVGSLFGIARPEFIWRPSYGSSVNSSPKVMSIEFDDGYEQRINKNINNDLLKIDYSFDLRRTDETAAIAHFLHNAKGSTSFIFTPNSPYAQKKLFVCKDWNVSDPFFNNYTVRARFEEVAA